MGIEKVTTPNRIWKMGQWKMILDDKGFRGAVLMDLSKAFDTLNYELLIVNLHAYGFNRDSLIKSNEFSTSTTFNEIVCRSLIWILSISMDGTV